MTIVAMMAAVAAVSAVAGYFIRALIARRQLGEMNERWRVTAQNAVTQVGEKAAEIARDAVAEHIAKAQEALTSAVEARGAEANAALMNAQHLLQSVADEVEQYELRMMRRTFDALVTLRHAVNAYIEEQHGVSVSDQDWNRILVERAFPILIAKTTAESLLKREPEP